ncbi:hypothetical protein AKJ56_00835 [candidate division MSBL1 archaeon SCGC-AAA382N08]|uniref:Uncharacterized protein n=1 Tax=candidate division MSBL1 archaeon SCGC-AAA382N08 TaxID=1698285 RepID=A0A133VQ94_9EURY|nr:hypothetical protein AKJ56_00835 [candidate division MSBL1 archaeon SCGC-AAA382N08]
MSSKNIANPAPLGLAGFGFTTILLNLVNAGLIGTSTEVTLVLTMGLFFGGLCQFVAGYWAYKLDEVFPATAFSAYGAFWETFAFYLLLTQVFELVEPAAGTGLGAYLILWGIFTFYMWINSFYHNWNLVGVFGTLWVLFFLLGVHGFYGGNSLLQLAGWLGIVCGSWAVWTSFCFIFQEHTDIKLPGIGKPLQK